MTIICDHCGIMIPERSVRWVGPMYALCPRCVTTDDNFESSPNVYGDTAESDHATRGHGSQCVTSWAKT